MATYLFVHGSWHGAWCWDRVAPLLEQAGHTVVAPDLPGHGRDQTPLNADLAARYVPAIADLLAVQPAPVILVGHSSGGMIISAAAASHPENVALLVYLAAFLLPAGMTPPMVMRDDAESLLPAALVVDQQAGTVSVAPDRATQVFYADCDPDLAAWATRQLVPEPIMASAPVAAVPDAGEARRLPCVYIETLHDRALSLVTQRRMYAALPCNRVYSLPASHSPFLSTPGQLAACLLDAARLTAQQPGQSSENYEARRGVQRRERLDELVRTSEELNLYDD